MSGILAGGGGSEGGRVGEGAMPAARPIFGKVGARTAARSADC